MSKEKAGVIFIVVFICLAVLWQLRLTNKLNAIKRNFAATRGEVTNFYRGGGKNWSLSVEYKYEVDKKIYTATNGTEREFSDHEEEFIGKMFDVVYDSTNPGNSRIMISPEERSEFQQYFNGLQH